MMHKLKLTVGNPYPLGVTMNDSTINFAVSMTVKSNCGLVLYSKKTGREKKIPFQDCNRNGNIYCIGIRGLIPEEYEYNYYCDDRIVIDPYARKLSGHEKWGQAVTTEGKNACRAVLIQKEFDWEEDKNPHIPYEESILYCLHVRGFTKHSSSKVDGKGTFYGIQEKIPYLKQLGITSVELMPCYEFDEIDVNKEQTTMSYALEHYKDTAQENKESLETKMNYWGYKKGYYFTPKASYARNTKEADGEFKNLMKSLHKEKMELIMQFYFPATVKPGFILEVLRFWVLEYHIDGIHLQGENLPITLIATDPLFSNTKLIYYDFSCDEIYEEGEIPFYRNLASCNDYFMKAMRKFLKSDEDMLPAFLEQQRRNPLKEASVHYMTYYYGFTMADLVSYDKKHNEANGEDNRDGESYNFSWNCGVEGVTRKKAILKLRIQQMKNAFVFLILAQGTPMIMSGDEFANTQNGNNNPYCQDNMISWLNWNQWNKNQEIYQFVKALIELRKVHPVFRKRTEAKLMDTLSCGYPDLSYHSEDVWRPVIDNYNRHIGIMYCGMYAKQSEQENDDFFYMAYNMHWEVHEFSMPNLPKDKRWVKFLTTAEETFCESEKMIEEDVPEENMIRVPARSITIMISE